MRLVIQRALAGAMAVVCLLAGQALADDGQRAADETNLNDVQLLGKRIFEDASLSEPRGMACMSCHDPRHAFQGGNNSSIPGVALGSRADRIGARKVPTLMYKSFAPPFKFYKDTDDGKIVLEPKGGQFWDGRADDLAGQVKGPLVNPDEMNNPSLDAAVDKIAGGEYASLAKRALGEDLFEDKAAAMDKLAGAVAAYEETDRFKPFSSKFDDWLRGKAQLTALEKRGYRIFIDPKRGNCTACHAGTTDSKYPDDWLFTDFTYVDAGLPRNPALPANADPKTYDLGLCASPTLAAKLPEGKKREDYCGQFKTPTLRNIAVAKSFFHNAVFTSLRDAVAFYATRDTDPAHWYRASGEARPFNDQPVAYLANIDREVPYDRKIGQKPRLDNGDIDALVAFLKTLTDKGME